MKRSRAVANVVASVGALAVGVIAAAPQAVAGPAAAVDERDYLKMISSEVRLTNQNVGQALELGYTLCKLEQVAPGNLNYNNVIVMAARWHLCGAMEPARPNPEGLAIQADIAERLTRQMGLSLGYVYVPR